MKPDSTQAILDKWKEFAESSADLLEAYAYQIDYDILKSKRNLPRVRRARRQFRRRLKSASRLQYWGKGVWFRQALDSELI
jgi:S-methylmethionine-dependent homocysteine/selenocysteine methylase